MSRTLNITEEIIVVSHGEEDTGKMAMLGANGKFHQSVIPEIKVSTGVLPGAIQYYAMSVAPVGWLKADGAAVSRLEYADLFKAIGITFGAGDGITTFNLPDLRGQFIRGLDDERGIDTGRQFGSEQTDALQNITGTFSGYSKTSGATDMIVAGAFDSTNNGLGECAAGNAATFKRTISFDASKVARTSSETRPRNVALLACIKY